MRRLLTDLAGDPHPGLREHALRVAADVSSSMFRPDDCFPRRRLHQAGGRPRDPRSAAAALALGDRCRNEPAALEALGKIAAKDADDPVDAAGDLERLG